MTRRRRQDVPGSGELACIPPELVLAAWLLPRSAEAPLPGPLVTERLLCACMQQFAVHHIRMLMIIIIITTFITSCDPHHHHYVVKIFKIVTSTDTTSAQIP